MFEHREIDEIPFETVPTDEEVFLIDEAYLEEYDRYLQAIIAREQVDPPGQVGYAGVRRITNEGLEVSWYPNITDRFHEVAIFLPRDQFVACVGCQRFDEKPHIFVKGKWLDELYSRPYSAFALIDAVGVKVAIKSGRMESSKLEAIRSAIDELANLHPEIAFVSFADSILLKSRWRPGLFSKGIKYSYEPEALVKLFPDISSVYSGILGLNIYAVITQGNNEYRDNSLLHFSPGKNHVCLNSLGLPFAQVMEMDASVRSAIRKAEHEPAELYLDQHFYHSIRFRNGFDKHAQPSARYETSLSEGEQRYYYTSSATVLENLDTRKI